MKKITVSVDDETHRIAKARAAEKGMSLSALVREYLCNLSSERTDASEPIQEAFGKRGKTLGEIVSNIRQRGGSIRSADNIPREELYDRNALR